MADAAKNLSPGATEVPLLGEEGAKAIEQHAIKLGILCGGCGNAMGVGYEFVSLRPVLRDGERTILVARVFICSEPGCAEAREKAREAATAVRAAVGWQLIEEEAELAREPNFGPEGRPGPGRE